MKKIFFLFFILCFAKEFSFSQTKTPVNFGSKNTIVKAVDAIAADSMHYLPTGSDTPTVAMTLRYQTARKGALIYHDSVHNKSYIYYPSVSVQSWQELAVGGSGVTSVGLAAPSIFTVTGSPVTSTGTLTFTSNNTTGDIIYGSASNTLAYLSDVSAGSYLRSGGVTTAPLWSTVKIPNTAVSGDLWIASATNTITALPKATNGQFLTLASGLPAWVSISASDISGISATAPITYSGGVISTSMSTGKLIGRYSGGSGVMQEITLSTGLALDGSGNLTATGITGDVTWSVLDILNTPPGSPADGDAYLVGTAGTGAWSGHNNEIAVWDAGGSAWTFSAASSGDLLYNDDTNSSGDNGVYKFNGSTWTLIGKSPWLIGGITGYTNPKLGTIDNKGMRIMTHNISRIAVASNGDISLPGLTASRPLKLDASKIIVSTQIDLSSTNDITNTLTVSHGGTGAATLTGVLVGNGTSAVTATAIAQGDVPYGSATGTLSMLAKSTTAGFVLTNSGTSNNPAWAAPFTLTTTGTSGAATFSAGTLNIPQYAGGVSSVSDDGGGTLTVSPTTGAVLAGIALGHANTWTANVIWQPTVSTGTGATAGMQIAANSLTTGNGIDASSSSLTTGNLMKLTSTSTAANAFSLLNINSSGANASSTRTATGQTISVTNTGTTSTNVGLNITASGATTNYGFVTNASALNGIGTATPTALFQVAGGISLTAANIINGSVGSFSAQTITDNSSSGSVTLQSFGAIDIQQPTFTTTNVTTYLGNYATLRIANAPARTGNLTMSGNAYALLVTAGTTQLQATNTAGLLTASSGVTVSASNLSVTSPGLVTFTNSAGAAAGSEVNVLGQYTTTQTSSFYNGMVVRTQSQAAGSTTQNIGNIYGIVSEIATRASTATALGNAEAFQAVYYQSTTQTQKATKVVGYRFLPLGSTPPVSGSTGDQTVQIIATSGNAYGLLIDSSNAVTYGAAAYNSTTATATFWPIYVRPNSGNLEYCQLTFTAIGAADGTVPTSRLLIGAGSATANTAPLGFTSGTLETTARAGTKEYNNSFYATKNSTLRYGEGGTIADFTSDVNNSGTGETDIYTYTTPASTLAATGEKLMADFTGTFNDITATGQLQVYFGGTLIGNTGALTISATGAWVVKVMVIRTGSTTARASVNVSTPGGSTALYTAETDITGLTFTNTNIIKITGTAGGAGGGSSDITGKLGTIAWFPSAAN